MRENELILIVDQDNTVVVVVAKKYLDNNQVAVVSFGYEGGGCWSDYNAIIQMDKYDELVEKYISLSFYEDSDNQEYEDYYSELYTEIKKHINLDNEDDVPTLIHTTDDYITIPKYYNDYNLIDLNWDWDTDILLVISKDWPFKFSFLENNDYSNE